MIVSQAGCLEQKAAGKRPRAPADEVSSRMVLIVFMVTGPCLIGLRGDSSYQSFRFAFIACG